MKSQSTLIDRAAPFSASVPQPGAGIKFELPPELQAHEPPEARGLARDKVRLMVSHYLDNRVEHKRFRDLATVLEPGDVLVINTSGTLNAAIPVEGTDGTELVIHLSTQLEPGVWVVELRRLSGKGTVPFYDATPGLALTLPGGASIHLREPHPGSPGRLWIADLDCPEPLVEYLDRYGKPIRYGYVPQAWDSTFYQTVYVTEMGSAEMPSAGRPFSPELVTRLVARGVHVVPLILHAGVASLESNEPPYQEYYRVTPETARVVNWARAEHRRIVGVGTTAVRALETVTDVEGVTWAGEGWTELFVTPVRGIRAVNGLITGFHEPRSTHLAILEALAGREHVGIAYAEALEQGYLWHEFGDLHLILA